VLFISDASKVIAILAATSQRIVPGRSRPRRAHRIKPRPSVAYTGWGISSVD